MEGPGKNETAASALKMHAEDLLELDVIDAMIEEPLGGAHHDPQVVYRNTKRFVVDQWNALKMIPLEILVEQRYQKFRKIGKFIVEDNATI